MTIGTQLAIAPRRVLVAVLLRHALRYVAHDSMACEILRTAYESVSPYTEVTL